MKLNWRIDFCFLRSLSRNSRRPSQNSQASNVVKKCKPKTRLHPLPKSTMKFVIEKASNGFAIPTTIPFFGGNPNTHSAFGNPHNQDNDENDRLDYSFYSFNFFCIKSSAAFGSALPFVSCMTLPSKKFAALGLRFAS